MGKEPYDINKVFISFVRGASSKEIGERFNITETAKQIYVNFEEKRQNRINKIILSQWGNVSVLNDYFDLLKDFERYLRDGVEKLMIAAGVNANADILDGIDVSYQKDLFQLLAFDYYQYLSKGRRPRARKVPVQVLIQWIKDKRIPYKGSINAAAFAIQTSIYKFGIVGKNYEEAVLDFTVQAISEYTSLYLQDTSTLNIIHPFYKFKNNEFIAMGVEYGEVRKAAAIK